MSEESSALKVINLSDILYEHTPENPPHRCESHRENEELHKLEHRIYRDSYSPMVCETCECEVQAYSREIGSYDEWDIEVICRYDWEKLPIKPKRLEILKKEIRDGKDAEYKLGIYHFRNSPHWHLADMMKTIEVPKLELRLPEIIEYPHITNAVQLEKLAKEAITDD